MAHLRTTLASALLVSALAGTASAAIVTFTGGVVTRLDLSTETTNNIVNWDNVDYYEEGGFRLDFLPNGGSVGFATNVGNYYGVGNDVIHSHWVTGSFGAVELVEITKILPGTFDLNFLTITSNTDTGGSAASGNEEVYIEGFLGGSSVAGPVRLPSQDWGFPALQVPLGAEFDVVDRVIVYAANRVDCFGMDDFAFDEVPAPGTLALLGLGGVAVARRRRAN